jgi:hypothetical protein
MIPRIAGGAVAAALLVLAAPIPAMAGGPTSVLLASPTRGVAAALYMSDSAYGRLRDLLGENLSQDKDAPDLRGGPGSDAINVTWMIHDVQVWRVDRVFVDAAGGPWIETVMTMDGASPFETPAVVHRSSDPKELVSLLSTMRLVGPDAVSNQGVLREVSPAADSAPVAPTAAEPVPADVDWVWALAGAAAGAMLVVVLRPLVRWRRAH